MKGLQWIGKQAAQSAVVCLNSAAINRRCAVELRDPWWLTSARKSVEFARRERITAARCGWKLP